MNKKLVFIYIMILIRVLVSNIVHPVTPSFLIELNVSDYMFGIAYACMAFTIFFFSPFWGKLANKIGDMRAYSIGYIGYGIAQFFFMNSVNPIQIIFARLLAGIFVGPLFVAELIYITNNSNKKDVARNLSLSATLMAVANPFGYLIGGSIGSISIKTTFMVQVIGLISLGIIAMFVKPSNKVEPFELRDIAKGSNPFKAFADIKGHLNIALIIFMTIVVITMVAQTGFNQSFNYYVIDIFKLSISNNGILKAVIGLISLAINSTITLWLVRKKLNNSLIIVFIVFATAVALMTLSSSYIFIILAIVAYGANATFMPIIQSVLSKINKGNSETVFGFFGSMKGLGMFLGGFIIGFIYDFNPMFSFYFVILLAIIVVILAFRLRKELLQYN